MIHELVLALQHGRNEWTRYDVDEVEKKTELETVARLPAETIRGEYIRTTGYYQYHPSLKGIGDDNERREKIINLMLEDKKLVDESMEGLKGKGLKEAIDRAYPRSNIAQVHFSPAEKLDRYFTVEKGRFREDIHMRFTEPKKVKLEKIVKGLVKYYGPGVKVYEWRDGKKVRVY
jgi:hypothetical protein